MDLYVAGDNTVKPKPCSGPADARQDLFSTFNFSNNARFGTISRFRHFDCDCAGGDCLLSRYTHVEFIVVSIVSADDDEHRGRDWDVAVGYGDTFSRCEVRDDIHNSNVNVFSADCLFSFVDSEQISNDIFTEPDSGSNRRISGVPFRGSVSVAVYPAWNIYSFDFSYQR